MEPPLSMNTPPVPVAVTEPSFPPNVDTLTTTNERSNGSGEESVCLGDGQSSYMHSHSSNSTITNGQKYHFNDASDCIYGVGPCANETGCNVDAIYVGNQYMNWQQCAIFGQRSHQTSRCWEDSRNAHLRPRNWVSRLGMNTNNSIAIFVRFVRHQHM